MRAPQRTSVRNPHELLTLVGKDLGVSEPRVITQEEVDVFAAVTKDDQWIHVDVDRARSGPFGTTIVHGFFTLALVPRLLSDILEVQEFSMGVNYRLDRVRFVQPLPPGTPVQATATLLSAEALSPSDRAPQGGVQAKASVVVDFVGESRTCCAAEILFRYYA